MPKVNCSKRDVLVGVPALIEYANAINRKTWVTLCSGQKESTLKSEQFRKVTWRYWLGSIDQLNSVFQEQIMVRWHVTAWKNGMKILMLLVESQTPITTRRFCCRILILPYSTEQKLHKVVNTKTIRKFNKYLHERKLRQNAACLYTFCWKWSSEFYLFALK